MKTISLFSHPRTSGPWDLWRAFGLDVSTPRTRARVGFWYAMSPGERRWVHFFRPDDGRDGWQLRVWRFAVAVLFKA